jgi:hypothetical protein
MTDRANGRDLARVRYDRREGDLTRRAAQADAGRPAPLWRGLADDARSVAVGFVGAGVRTVRHLPGTGLLLRGARRVEDAVLGEIGRRLADRDAANQDAGRPGSRARMLDELLHASLDPDPDHSRERLHLRILASLVPDEARILAALADGTHYPLAHVRTRGPGATRTVLANASTVGRAAGAHLRSAVPTYIGHLLELGLVEEGPKEDALGDQYNLLGSEDVVKRALEDDSDGGPRGNKMVYRSLRISPLGAELWEACRGTDDGSGVGDSNGYRSAYAGERPDRSGRSGKRGAGRAPAR